MRYLVLEIQAGDTISVLVNDFDELSRAENKYHTILAYAAISEIPIHSALLMTEEGIVNQQYTYKHSK